MITPNDRTANNPAHRFFHHEQSKNMSNVSSDGSHNLQLMHRVLGDVGANFLKKLLARRGRLFSNLPIKNGIA
jgi:hypothetical protein